MLDKTWQILRALELALVIAAFLWFGWSTMKINADQQLEVLKGVRQDVEARAKQSADLTQLLRREIELRAAQSDALTQIIGTLRKGEGFAVGAEILKIVFSPQQKCFSEDQYFMIEFLAEVFNAASEIKADKDAFINLTRKRSGCAEAPATGAEARDGYVVLGVPAVVSGRIKEFTNFTVHAPAEGIDLEKRSKNILLKPKFDMNIRANTNDIGLGLNPSIGLIPASKCAGLTDFIADLRGNAWARVVVADCQ